MKVVVVPFDSGLDCVPFYCYDDLIPLFLNFLIIGNIMLLMQFALLTVNLDPDMYSGGTRNVGIICMKIFRVKYEMVHKSCEPPPTAMPLIMYCNCFELGGDREYFHKYFCFLLVRFFSEDVYNVFCRFYF
jgi:hypothetical protein